MLDGQKDSLKQVLSQEDQGTSPTDHTPFWKVLIYDDFTFEIISTFKMGFLRNENITLHLHIDSTKEVNANLENSRSPSYLFCVSLQRIFEKDVGRSSERILWLLLSESEFFSLKGQFWMVCSRMHRSKMHFSAKGILHLESETIQHELDSRYPFLVDFSFDQFFPWVIINIIFFRYTVRSYYYISNQFHLETFISSKKSIFIILKTATKLYQKKLIIFVTSSLE